MNFGLIRAGAVALAAMSFSAPAMAASVSAAGDTASFYNSSIVDGVTLEAKLDWILSSVSSTATKTSWTFFVTVSNLTADQANTNRLTSWGFNTTPDSSVNESQDIEVAGWTLVDDPNGNVPNGLGSYEVCADANGGGANCNGGGGGGFGEGVSDTFKVVVDTALTNPTLLTFDSVYVRYQSIGTSGTSTAFTLKECVPGSFECPKNIISPVPVPASLPLLLGGLLGGGALLRRKSRKA